MELKEFIDQVNDRMINHPVFEGIAEPEYRDWAKDYLQRGAKRIRVAMVWAACDMFECKDWDTAIDLATAVELTHNWTLVEDDWMDRDPERRGVPTMHVLRAREAQGFANVGLAEHYGQTVATLITNLLQAAASQQMAIAALKLDDPKAAVEYYEQAVAQVIRGQLMDFGLQERMLKSELPSEKEVADMVTAKTASLFRLAFWLAATVCRVNPKDWEELGTTLGMIFQFRDDLSDTVPKEGGANQMGDVLEMKPTLLNVRMLAQLSEPDKSDWLEAVAARSEVGALVIVGKMGEAGIVEQAQSELLSMFEDIRTKFSNLPESSGKRFLQSELDALQKS